MAQCGLHSCSYSTCGPPGLETGALILAPSGANPQAADNPHAFPPVLTPWSGSGTRVLESLPPTTSRAPASPPQPERSVGTQRSEAQLGWAQPGGGGVVRGSWLSIH